MKRAIFLILAFAITAIPFVAALPFVSRSIGLALLWVYVGVNLAICLWLAFDWLRSRDRTAR